MSRDAVDSAIVAGGGDMLRLIDNCLDSSTCAFLLWLGARCGTAGVGSAESDGPLVVIGLLEKKSFFSPKSENGVIGVTGESSEDEELSAVRNPLSILAKSESECTESAEEDDAVLDRVAPLLISGAFKASTFVVESNLVGREIFARLIVPGVYCTLHDRGRVVSSPRVWPRARRVRFRTSDILLG